MNQDSVAPSGSPTNSPPAEPPQPPTEAPSWWTDARKVLVGQILTILLTPASVAATYYLTELYKAPKARLEYVTASPYYLVEAPPPELAKRLSKAWMLATAFRDEFEHGPNPKGRVCAAWMDGGEWDAECPSLYLSSAQRLQRSLEYLVRVVKPGSPSPKQAVSTAADRFLESMIPDHTLATANLQVLQDVITAVDDLSRKKQARSGGVIITVGVLNRGDSDGTVFQNATVHFLNKTLTVSSEDYVSVKAHSFAKVTFEAPSENDGQYFGAWAAGQEPAVKQWSDLAKAGVDVPFELTVSLSDKPASIHGLLPKEE